MARVAEVEAHRSGFGGQTASTRPKRRFVTFNEFAQQHSDRRQSRGRVALNAVGVQARTRITEEIRGTDSSHPQRSASQ